MVHIKFLWNICYMHIHIYIYIRATTSRQPSFGPRISRIEMSDSDTTGNIRGQSLEKEGGGPPRLNTEYENVCRLEFDFATDRSEVRGGSFSLSRIRSLFLLSAKFFFYYADRGGRRRVIRAISGTTEEISAVADHRPLPPWKVFVGRCSSGQSSYTFDNVR